MEIALTGGTGTLGRTLLPALLAAGHTVRLLLRPDGVDPSPAFPAGVTPVRVALTDVAAVAAGFGSSTLVIHAAALQTGTPAEQRSVAIDGTHAVLAAMEMAQIKHLVGLSSLAVYDYSALRPGTVLNETSGLENQPDRRDTYTQCKLAQDELFRQAGLVAHRGLTAIVLRPGIFYTDASAWPIGLGKAVGARHWALMGPLNRFNRLPLVHADDVARGVVAAVSRLSEVPRPFGGVEVFNLVEPDLPLATELLAALQRLPSAPSCLRVPWGVQHGGAFVLAQLDRLLGQRLPIPGLLRPDWMASRFCQLEFDVSHAQTALGWNAQHRILNTLASLQA